MHISPQNLRLLEAIDLSADLTRVELAQKLRAKTSTIHAAVSSLTSRGILTRRARIDFFKLGLLDVVIYFSLGHSSRSARGILEKWLVADERTGWVGRLSGDYQYAALVLVKSLKEVSVFLDELNALKGVTLRDRILAPRMVYRQFSRKFGTAHSARREVNIESTPETFKPSEIEHKILSVLGRGPFDSIRAIARDLKLPFSTVEYNFLRLKEAGIIRGVFYEVNPSALGLQSFRLIISTQALTRELSRAFERYVGGLPEVVFIVKAMGGWDYELGLEVRDAARLFELVGEVTELLGPHLNFVKTLQEVADLKWTFYPFKGNL